MPSFTRSELRDRIRRLADIVVDDGFITDTELNDYIQEGVNECYDMMIHGDGVEVFVKNHPIPTQVGQYAYELADDFYRLSGVYYYVGGRYLPGSPGDPRRYPEYAANPPEEESFIYYLRMEPGTGAKYLYVFPEVDENNLAIVYIPHAPTLTNDASEYDGLNGWDEWVVVSSAIKALEKQQKDTASLQIRLQRIQKRIQSHASYLDTGLPNVIKKVHPSHPTMIRK